MDQQTQIATQSQTQLTPAHPQVQVAAKALGVEPAALVKRINRALPSVIAQQVYLQLCPNWNTLTPEDTKHMLQAHLGNKAVPSDTDSRTFDDLVEFLFQVLDMDSESTKDLEGIVITKAAATELVTLWGIEQAKMMIADVAENLAVIRERLGLPDHTEDQDTLTKAINFLVRAGRKKAQDGGVDYYTGMDYFRRTGRMNSNTVQNLSRDITWREGKSSPDKRTRRTQTNVTKVADLVSAQDTKFVRLGEIVGDEKALEIVDTYIQSVELIRHALKAPLKEGDESVLERGLNFLVRCVERDTPYQMVMDNVLDYLDELVNADNHTRVELTKSLD